jgi:transposase
MIHLTADTAILIATQPADFRKGIDGFVGLCQQDLAQNPRSGTLYVFINRAANRVT